MANIIQGGDLMLFVDTAVSGDPVYKSIGFATSHTLEVSAETSDVASKDHGIWNTKEIKTFSWTCSSENLYSNNEEGVGYSELFEYMVAKKHIKAVFSLKKSGTGVSGLAVPAGGWTPTETAGDVQLEGEMVISSLSLNAPNGDNATFSVNFEGASELKKVTVA